MDLVEGSRNGTRAHFSIQMRKADSHATRVCNWIYPAEHSSEEAGPISLDSKGPYPLDSQSPWQRAHGRRLCLRYPRPIEGVVAVTQMYLRIVPYE